MYSFIFLFVAGCGLKKPILHDTFQNKEIIAKYADLPDVPFAVKLQSISMGLDDQCQIQMFYTTKMTIHELIEFYQQQMERNGWDLLAKSHAQDCLLQYVKPMQICSILISDNKLAIYLGDKKGA